MYLLFAFLSYVISQTKLNLQGALPLHMDCSNIAEKENGFIGLQYFYDYLSQQGQLNNLDQLTFSIWIMVHSQMKIGGRQIVFAFVDGYTKNPYLNLMLYYQLESSDYYMYLANSKLQPEILKLKIDQQNYILSVNNLYRGYWNHILLSIDSRTENTFINLKFFSTYNYQLSQKLETLVTQKLIYQFGSHSRITNEQLYDMTSDYMACIDVANFDFINGWTMMDTEIYVDYDVQLKFLVKPFQAKSINVENQFQDITLRVSPNQASYSGTIGLNLYRDKQIVYSFEEQMSSFTVMFWVQPNSINRNFQFFSFTDDLVQETSIGFGVNQFYQLVQYQAYTVQNQLGYLQQSVWKHVIIGLLDISINGDFIPQNLKKVMRTYIDASQTSLIIVQNIKAYKRLVIGPVFKDIRGNEYIDIQDIRIFKGYGILQSSGDCQYFVGPYCAFCKPGTHYCKEQDPYDDLFFYNCPAGYQEQSGTCVLSTIPNCLRQQDSTCKICASNYWLDNSTGRCILTSNQPKSPFYCQDTQAIFCQKTILNSLSTSQKQEVSKLCQSNVPQYNSGSYTCWGSAVNSCNQAQYLNQCYRCTYNYALTESKTCRWQCTANYRFNNNQICQKSCNSKYLYTYSCIFSSPYNYITYSCNPNSYCQQGEIDLGYYCLKPDEQRQGKTKGCIVTGRNQMRQGTIYCHYTCKYCFGPSDQNCLGCYSDKFYNPYLTACVTNCSNKGLFKYNNQQTKVCELQCPSYLYTKNLDCVADCGLGYALYKNTCLPNTYLTENYLTTSMDLSSQIIDVMLDCPQLCQTCTSFTICTSCLNTYPIDQGMCVISCFPKFLLVQDNAASVCLSSCNPTDLIYQNNNFNGYQINQCFPKKCGQIKANKIYQTYLHQTNINRCMQPCDDGYYGHPATLLCTLCDSNCFTCQDFANFCTSCNFMEFLLDNVCFNSCGTKFKNYLNWSCEGTCSSGYSIADKNLNIYGCVEQCGQIYAQYVYTFQSQCLDTIPLVGAYCIGNTCYECSEICKTCSGPTSNECLSCYSKTYLSNNSCVINCGLQMYDMVNWQCVDDCPSSTFKTNSGSTYYCSLTCLFNQYQYKGKCSGTQPFGTFCQVRTNYIFCDGCADVCKTCTTSYSTSCSQCNPGAYLDGTTCYSDCSNSAPYKDAITNKCVASCNNYLEDGFCVNVCQPTSYIYTQQMKCFIMGCPEGTYQQLNTNYCYPCYTGCSTCTGGGANQCLSCISNYFYNSDGSCSTGCLTNPYIIQDWVNSLCVQQCPFGTYMQSLSGGALACKDTCPLYYYSNICVPDCPNQTFQDGQFCISCAGPCSVCYGAAVNQCTQCDIGFYLYDTTCVEICPILKPFANLVDQTCVTICPSYLYSPKNYCFNPCPGFLYYYELNGQKECVDQCYSKSYLWLGKCYACNSICKECFGPNNGNCLECELPYFLDQQTCGNTCPQFYDLTDHVCKDACPVNLVIQGMNCQNACDSGYLVYNQVCISTCPSFAYKVGNHCYDCNLFCSTCFGPTADDCYSCIDNYFLDQQSCKSNCPQFSDIDNKLCVSDCSGKYEYTDKMQCVTVCPLDYLYCLSKCVKTLQDGYYQDGNHCQQCDPKCLKCTSATVCQACSNNFYLEVNSCVNYCSNQYLFMDPISGSCVTKCPSTLYHFESFGKRFCVSECPYKLFDHCVIACPSGMYPNNTICTQCPQFCDECESATKCSVCQFGYYFQNNQCQLSCTTGKTDRKNIQCVDQCDPTLFEYQNECLENCPTDPIYYKNKQICASSCPIKTYQNQQDCLDCNSSCTACIGPSFQDCITCSDGYYLDNQICTQTCSNLYDEVNKQCVLTCPANLYQDINKCVAICSTYEYNSVCVSACPSLTYVLNSKCYDCSENCQECNSFGCTKCAVGTYLNDGLCNNYCPYYYNDVNNECAQLCPKDTYLYIDHCYSQCPLSTFQYKKDCLLACPSLTVVQNTLCLQCPERCVTCKSEYECSKCESPYFLFDGSCVVHCPLQLPFEDITNGQCVSVCPPDAYERRHECIKECNLIIYQKQCLQTCPTGYYGNDYCKPCRLECKACSSFEVCTECNDNFFLEFNQCDTLCTKIKDLKSKSCVDTCNLLLYKNVCYETCPLNTYENVNECVLTCNEGYYGSLDYKCLKCPSQCGTCTNALQCTKCNIGYFLYNKQCLDQCPGQFFSNPILNECSTKCPLTTFTFQNSCLFECPSEYLNDMENYKCVNNCGTQQYLSKKNCLRCAIECDSCTGRGNNNCIKCANGFNLTQEGLCLGNCKDGYYQSDNSCQQCLHKCQTCENGTDCTKCRGTNRNTQDCSCQKGYYDDEYQDDCKKCPCDECTASDNCLICKNNLQVPKCSCDRILNEDWCITCQVAKVNIYYSDDLNEIIVYFGYLISVNLINPFQPSDCLLWFDNSEIFGQNAQCYLSWNRYAVHIILKPYASVTIGDKLSFKNSFYRDVDQGICDGQFMEEFIENKVREPKSLYKPYILFDIPSFVSTCKTIYIKQILLDGTGQKIQNVLSWTLKEMKNEEQYLQMDAFLDNQLNEITIPIRTLQPNVTYTITAKYVNFMQRVNFTTFTFTTLPVQAPYVFLSYEPLMARVYVFDCLVSYSDMKNEFNVAVEITDGKNKTYISLTQQINPIYEIPLNESLLPKEAPLVFTASTGSSIIIETIYLKSKIIDIKFLQKNRFIGLDNQINARGFDRNIQDEVLSTMGINYEWQCNSLNNLQPCKTEENQIMQFPSRRVVNIFADSQNTTIVFFAKASKGDRWTVKEQLIVITDFNIEEEFNINNNDPQNYINANDEVTILIKKQQKYAFIIQQHKILQSMKISSMSLKFRLAGLTTDYISPVYIYLVPGNESIAFKLNDPPQQVIFQIEPLIGESLEIFNYTLSNLQAGNLISFYYYFENSILENDVNTQSIINGIPLITDSNETVGQFQLPNGITNNSIQVLCEISSSYGAKSYLKQEVYVIRKNYELQQLYQSFSSKINFENLQSLHTMIALIQLEEQQVCLKQCSGVGTCVNKKCQCPPGYYFADCSGNQEKQIKFNDLMTNTMSSLVKIPITNNNDMKLFSQSLYFLTQFSANNKLSLEDCSIVLQQYLGNTNSRLEQINQYSINLQFQSTDDFNYSQIDIRSLVNKNDLHTALKSTVFMWEQTLFSSGSNVYQLQNHLNNLINNIIELTIFSLSPNDKIDYSIDTASITIQKSQSLPYNKSRVLEEINSQKSASYDIVYAIYIRNFYAFDGYFPYPQQIYPLYDYQIRQSSRKENIELDQPISYRFGIQNDTTNLVCLQRNAKTYEWFDQNCTLSEINSTYYCNCTTLSPTTICNDYNFLYQGSSGFRINLPNIFYIFYILQLIILGIFVCKSQTQNTELKTENTKFGHVIKLNKKSKVNIVGNKIYQVEQEKEPAELIIQPQLNNQDKKNDKFNFNHFWKYHCLTQLIHKQLTYISPFMRSLIILLRWNSAVIIGEVLCLIQFDYQVSIWIIFASIIIMRISENFLKKQIKYFFIMKQIILVIIIKGFILLLLLFTILCGVYLYLMIANQTNLILSYFIAILIDILLLDIIIFSSQRFLGENKKKNLRKTIKELKHIAKIQKQIN